MRLPSFRHMGGKARLRAWLVEHFPKKIKTYVEPFVGKGNVFYAAVTSIMAQRYVLSDIDVAFLLSILKADLTKLPEHVHKDSFAYWKTRNDDLSIVLEPRITFGGKGYKYGYSGDNGSHIGYRKQSYKKVCESARELLKLAEIKKSEWYNNLNWGSDDFVYLDPPYYETKASYGNIDHHLLLTFLLKAEFKWALSGYNNQLYADKLSVYRSYECVRNSEIKSSNAHKRQPVIETLWVNY